MICGGYLCSNPIFMYPILFEFQGIVITSFGLFLTLGFIAFIITLVRLTPSRNVNINFFSDHILSLFLGSVLGTKLLFWICNALPILASIRPNWDFGRYYAIFKLLFNIEEFYIIGGVVAFAALFFIYARKHKEPLLKWLDCLMPSLAIALFFGFIGSFLGGYFIGKETDTMFGVLFTSDPRFSLAANVASSVPVHPIQLYAAVIMLFIFFVTFELVRKIRTPGVAGVVGLLFISLADLLLEFLRTPGDRITFIANLTINQWISIAGIALAIYIFLRKVPQIGLGLTPEEADATASEQPAEEN